MSTPATPSSPRPGPAGDDRNLVAADATTALTLEDRMEIFWQKYRTALYGVCVLILLIIVGKGGWEYMARKKERDVQDAYAAATSNEQLKSFIAAHRGHTLGAIAELRLADEAYAAGKAADAVAGYDKALEVLKDGPLAARAKVGRAVAKAQSGKAAEATKELKLLADDAKLPKAVRSEAAYHVTSLAVDAADATEAQKMVDLLNQIDPMGAWSQRAVMLRATLPATPAPAAPVAPAAPAAAAGAENKDAPAVKLNLPGAEKK
jgi:hypothetical protein